MSITSVSLLERLKNARPDAEDWRRLHDIYLPMITRWLSRVPGMRGDDLPDLSQEVLVVLFKELPTFERQREGSFRKFLKLVVLNRARARWRDRQRRPHPVGGDATIDFFAQLEDPDSALSQEWDREHNEFVFKRLVAIVKPDFEPQTWEAFQEFAVDGIPAKQVAAKLAISENAVLLAKSRVLKRLRAESTGLID